MLLVTANEVLVGVGTPSEATGTGSPIQCCLMLHGPSIKKVSSEVEMCGFGSTEFERFQNDTVFTLVDDEAGKVFRAARLQRYSSASITAGGVIIIEAAEFAYDRCEDVA